MGNLYGVASVLRIRIRFQGFVNNGLLDPYYLAKITRNFIKKVKHNNYAMAYYGTVPV